MNEMLERVAKAIFFSRYPDVPAHWWNNSAFGKKDQEQARIDARAAIEAMSEPTEAMKVEAKWLDEQAGFKNLSLVASGYSLMVKTALK